MKFQRFTKPDPFDVALWGLLITAMICFIYYWQLRSMQESVDLARKSMEIDQRAWVGPKAIILKDTHAPEPLNADITILNSGKTPALRMRVRYYLYATDTPINISEFSKRVLAMPVGDASIGNLFPNVSIELIAPTGPTDELGMQSIKNGRKLLYFFAWVWYDDVFSRPHRTYFCSQYRSNGQVFAPCNGDYDYTD